MAPGTIAAMCLLALGAPARAKFLGTGACQHPAAADAATPRPQDRQLEHGDVIVEEKSKSTERAGTNEDGGAEPLGVGAASLGELYAASSRTISALEAQLRETRAELERSREATAAMQRQLSEMKMNSRKALSRDDIPQEPVDTAPEAVDDPDVVGIAAMETEKRKDAEAEAEAEAEDRDAAEAVAPDLEERVRKRAYFLWEAGSTDEYKNYCDALQVERDMLPGGCREAVPIGHEDWKYDLITEGELTMFNNLLVLIKEELNKEKVSWWLTDGTLIGAMRNKPPGQVRWDDDMDIGFIHEAGNDHRVEHVLKKLGGENKIEWTGNYDDFFQVRLADKDFKKEYYLDIFPFVKKNGPKGLACYFPHDKWPADRYYYFASEVGPNVENCAFNGETMSCPKNPIDILKRQYSADVMEEVQVWGHTGANIGKKFTFSLKDDVNRHMATLPALNEQLWARLAFSEPKTET